MDAIQTTDVLVIGGGLAGERCAIEAATAGHDVKLLSLVPPRRSHSCAAQGGMQAALGNCAKAEGDDPTTGQLSTITSPTGTIDVGYTGGHMTSLVSPSMAGPITTNIDYDGYLPTSVSWSGPVAGQVSWTYNDRFLIESETIGALPETTVAYAYDGDGPRTSAPRPIRR